MRKTNQRGSSDLQTMMLILLVAVVVWLLVPAVYPDLREPWWQFSWVTGAVLRLLCALKEGSHVA